MTEKFVTNLDLSKRLKELGVPQRSEFWWVRFTMGEIRLYSNKGLQDWDEAEGLRQGYNKIASSYLSDELLEWLPQIINEKYLGIDDSKIGLLDISKPNGYTIGYWQYKKEGNNIVLPKSGNIRDVYFVNALAKMMMFLLEKGIIQAKDLK